MGGGAKGTVDPSVLPPKGYTDSLLATFVLTDLSTKVGGSYPLQLELFRTLGATESVFVTAGGEQLDARLVFGSAMVDVIPEPSLVALVVLGLLCWPARRFVRCARQK